LGVSNHPISRLGGLSSIGVYLYEDIYYRQWITEIALAFYEGRQDEFVWLDLVRQFRNPEKQQIVPMNLTKEIIDETSILYREDPIYRVVNEDGKALPQDQRLWEKIMRQTRYKSFMDKLDRWTRLLGTVLVKVSFVDPNTGALVQETKGGVVQLDMLHGGVYDMKHGASPYYITELLIGFGTKFGGFRGSAMVGGSISGKLPGPGKLGQSDIATKQVGNPENLANINRIYWSPDAHRMEGDDQNMYEVKNPYGIVPAIPFFNQDPAHYYFLPIDEPLIYVNHASNMRITDLNHIAKFQSFGIPVVSGVERPTSVRQGRPVDDFNILRGGTAQSKFGGIGGITGFAAGGAFRTFDAGLGIFRDGNADAAALGMTIGPDTAIAVGEKGDFKFAHPNADITGLVDAIQTMIDMCRVNHGLRPKYQQSLPSSGFSLLMEKIGVVEDNIRRSKLFKEREEQLFQIIKRLWNTHYSKSGEDKFSDDSRLEVTYVQPKFPVDPKTQMETIIMENKILDEGDRLTYKKIYPYYNDEDIDEMIKQRRKDKLEQAKEDAKVEVEKAKILAKAGMDLDITKDSKTDNKGGKQEKDAMKVTKPKIDNKAKHSEDSGKQKGKNGDPRGKDEREPSVQ
jgi:hypothetical protein